MSLINFIAKNRYGKWGIITYAEVIFDIAVSVPIALSLFNPVTRNPSNYSTIFDIVIFTEVLIVLILTLRNSIFGLGQDIADLTIISLFQMGSRRRVFFEEFLVDILFPAVLFLAFLYFVLYLSGFSLSFQIAPYIGLYLFLSTASFFFTITLKKPLRSLGVFLLFAFSFFVLLNHFNALFVEISFLQISEILLFSSLFLLFISYLVFTRVLSL
ncbi:hypothetical protein [Acidianus sp. RZ1]|uniref:hypothetical protein n=1 Tax=Acidianus sp. RZ1 TaxID=1540082 RepID=UPI001490FFF4|nr:hypothetical protein [Acidianus sp. RZ1]NON61186.1 hypothetical protein [Acidianus sp. RZ1]